MAESNKINRAAEDNLDKMRMDQMRFEQSLTRNDRQSAVQFANAISQDKKAQAMLDIERQKLGLMGQQYANAATTPLQKIADDIQRADPSLDRRAALNEASKIAGYSFRTDAAMQGKRAAALASLEKMTIGPEDIKKGADPFESFAARKAEMRREIDRLYPVGGANEQGAGVTIPKGVTIEKLGG
jgi:hypothetical protein